MKRTSIARLAMAVVALGLICCGFTLTSAAQTFNYIADPPREAVVPETVTPGIHFGCETTQRCYRPSAVRDAYNFPSDLDGTGQTILIVDAFGSPTITQDLATFDALFGIPAPPSFTIFCPAGCPSSSFNNAHHDVVGWSFETSLDVEWAHAMAPGARIVLVVAPTSSGDAINTAEAAAIQRFPGAIMSQSFGIPEFAVHGNNAQILQAHRNFQAATAAGITLLASTGDFGATNGTSVNFANAGFPASDPLVTAVGGTQGNPYFGGLRAVSGGYGAEQVWNEPLFGVATGGAASAFFAVPAYQHGLGLQSRTIPDVAYNAAIQGGVLVLNSAAGGFFLVGGTSAGSPQWAAIIALANQKAGHSLGFVNSAIYSVAKSSAYANDFHDITTGDNKLNETQTGFSAATGYDFTTGWGTPNVANFIPDLVSAAASH